MCEDGKITQAEYEKAVSEEIVLNVSKSDDTVKNNYVDTYAYFCATEALMENEGFKFKYYFLAYLQTILQHLTTAEHKYIIKV